jgi:hypothetical protein
MVPAHAFVDGANVADAEDVHGADGPVRAFFGPPDVKQSVELA